MQVAPPLASVRGFAAPARVFWADVDTLYITDLEAAAQPVPVEVPTARSTPGVTEYGALDRFALARSGTWFAQVGVVGSSALDLVGFDGCQDTLAFTHPHAYTARAEQNDYAFDTLTDSSGLLQATMTADLTRVYLELARRTGDHIELRVLAEGDDDNAITFLEQPLTDAATHQESP